MSDEPNIPPVSDAELAKKMGVCPYCKAVQGSANIRFDPTPNGMLLFRFLCMGCDAVLSLQIGPPEYAGQGRISTPQDAGLALVPPRRRGN